MSLICRDDDGDGGARIPLGNLPGTWDRSVRNTMSGGMHHGNRCRNIRQDSASLCSRNFGVSDFVHTRGYPSRVYGSSQKLHGE